MQQTARIDFTLTVGQVHTDGRGHGHAALLTTENATVGTVIEEKRIVDLPLNGRNFFSLVALSPNVTYGFTPAQQASGRLGGSRSTLTMSLSGARATWTNYTLDGITNTDVDFNTYIVLPSVDALQEFKVQTGIYPAEFGREAGQVNVSTKPGTNHTTERHSTSFATTRWTPGITTSFGRSQCDQPLPPRRRTARINTASRWRGPVRIPKLFNGKNRLFFMSNFEGFKSRTHGYQRRHHADAGHAQRRFFRGPTTALQDPLTRAGPPPTSPHRRSPGNQIPSNRLRQELQLLMTRFDPLPNRPATPRCR